MPAPRHVKEEATDDLIALHGPPSSSARRPRPPSGVSPSGRKEATYATPHQIVALDTYFAQNHYPKPAQLQELAGQLGL